MDPHLPPATPFLSPWTERLFAEVGATERHLLLISPYIKDTVVNAVERALTSRLTTTPLSIRVLTRVRLDDLLAGASDLAALERILGWPVAHPQWSVEARALDNVHAKVWVMDERVAFIGSGNATGPGLEGNIEYGVELREPMTVADVLTDWNALWGKTAPIIAEALAPFRQALDALAADESVRAAQAALDQRHAALAKRVSAPSRLGASLPIAKSGLLPRADGARLTSLPSERHDIAVFSPNESPSNALSTATFSLEMRLDHMLKALHWVIPSVGDADDLSPQLSVFSALKITCERIDLDPRTGFGRTTFPSQLRLTWSDHVCDVEAALVAFTIESDAVDASVRGPWAVTLGSAAIQRLAAMLSRHQHRIPSEPNVVLVLRLPSEAPHARLSVAIWRVTLAGENLEEYADETLLEAPLTVDVTPAPWDEGFQDMAAQIVSAWVSGRELDHALQGLSSLEPLPGARTSVQRSAESPVVELRLGAVFDASALLLRPAGSKGTIDQAVPMYDLKGGSTPAFRIDQQALIQMARMRGVAGDGQSWTIRVPSHAEFIEFEPTYPLFADGFISLTRWRCRLRNVEA